MTDSYDLIVIGGGSAGYAGAATAASLGLQAAVIEGGEVGGLCILRGCMPSKTLLESANRYDAIRRAREFGLRADNHHVVGEEIIARKRRLIGEFADYRHKQLADGRFAFIRGFASFIDPHTVEVRWKDESPFRLRARTFLIATGSRLNFIDLPGLRECDVLDSDRVLESPTVPKSIVVLGAGAISMEFAHYYALLGTEVTVLQRSRQVLSGMDSDIAHAVSKAMEKRGVKFFFGTSLQRLERTSAGKRVHFRHERSDASVEAEEVLYALGRRPHTEGLALQAAGVETAEHRIVTNLAQQTSIPHIFAAGDATGPHEIVHMAIQQGELAAQNAAALLSGESRPLQEMDYRLRLSVVFTQPEVAVVGITERELMDTRSAYAVATYPFADHGKSIVMGETEGFVKLIAAETDGEILGGAAVGPAASELIHEIAVAMRFHGRVCDLARTPHYHPTLSEIWTYPAEELDVHCKHRPNR